MSILNNTINNVLSNLIPHETITCDDKKPPCFNKNIINLYCKWKYYRQKKSFQSTSGEWWCYMLNNEREQKVNPMSIRKKQ